MRKITAVRVLQGLVFATALVALSHGSHKCPGAPPGFDFFASSCIGHPGQGKSCANALATATGCKTTAACVSAATSACLADSRCKAFAVEINPASCAATVGGRYHTYAAGSGAVVNNSDWVTYATTSPPPPPAPSPSEIIGELRCGLRGLAVEVAGARLGGAFGLRAAQLVADAVRIEECNTSARALSGLQHKEVVRGLSPAGLSGIVMHIAPNGSDSTGDGSATLPFFSPARARDAVRKARSPPLHP